MPLMMESGPECFDGFDVGAFDFITAVRCLHRYSGHCASHIVGFADKLPKDAVTEGARCQYAVALDRFRWVFGKTIGRRPH